MLDSTTKRCTKCGEVYPKTADYFSRDKQRSDGLYPQCKICRRACSKKHYEENREAIIERTRIYAKAHPELRREIGKRYYWSHHEICLVRNRRSNAMRKEKKRAWYFSTIDERRAYGKKYRTKNHDTILARGRDYYAKNPEKALARWHTRRARELNAEGFYTPADIELLLKTQHGKCWWCGSQVGDEYNIDHRVALSIGGTNWPNNLCISCPSCNKSKGSKLPSEWIGRLL
jgi:5-methylcytosine-specific restriction endonuclease McrA